jgi:uncharacterized protein involved in exopolysaccharide biosynthesis
MIENRVLDLDDYLAIGRRHLSLIVFAALGATAVGFLISFAFSAQYSSSSLVLVERQTIPAGYVKPIVTSSLIDRIVTLEQRVLSRSQLEAMVQRLDLAKGGKSVDDVVNNIQRNVTFAEADPSASSSSASSSSSPSSPSSISRKSTDFVGFNVRFTASNPQDAQRICTEITSMVLSENAKMREQVAVSTTDFLSRQLAEAKTNLDLKDQELAAFKSRYLGQLPSDVETNARILSGLNAELDANTQSLNRAQQDKSYAESLLAQQIAAWNSSQTSQTEETIGQRLVSLRTQLVTLEARYTDDYPDVIKTKNDIAALEAKQKEMDNPKGDESKSGPIATNSAKPMAEPAPILQLRERVHQDDAAIIRASDEEKRLQKASDSYQGRLTLSPQVEEQYEQLTRDNEVAHQLYDTLLVNKSQSEIQTDLERSQQGEQLRLLDPASLPDSPSFPVRWKFAGGGFAGGLALGLAIAFWLELRDRTIRDERDVLAALDLPTLGSLAWVDPSSLEQSSVFRRRFKALLGA